MAAKSKNDNAIIGKSRSEKAKPAKAKKADEFDAAEIDSLINKINDLVSMSGIVDEEAADDPFSTVKVEEVHEDILYETQLVEIEKGKEKKLPTKRYAKPCYNWMQMREIRLGLMAGLDTQIYENQYFSSLQMKEIRLGLFDRLDVSSYANLMLSAMDMKKKRYELFAQSYQQNPYNFEKVIRDTDLGVVLRISNDCMNAYLTVTGDAKIKPTRSQLLDFLYDNEVSYGINIRSINRMLKTNVVDQEVCVATGKRPIVGTAGFYEVFFENVVEKGQIVAPDDEIDYSNVKLIDMVGPGTTLAKYHPAEKDVNGTTVTGISVYGVCGEELPKLEGVGFDFDEKNNTYIASKDGYPSYDKATCKLNVWMIYEVRGDVSYYQNVEYDGTIHVYGSVLNLAILRASGDIIIDGFVESAHIYAGQNIVIKGGVNGAGIGTIEAGGSVRGKFFEYATINARGLVESNYFLNCNILCDDHITAKGRKARIMGGQITAAVSIEAVIMGNYSSNKTVFNAGDISNLDKRSVHLKRTKREVSDELSQLYAGKAKLISLLGEDMAPKNALYTKTCAAIYTKEMQIEAFEKDIERLNLVMSRAQKAYIRAIGEMQSGVTTIVNGNVRKIEETLRRGVTITKKGIRHS